jgi:hypothetical protein
MERKFGSNTPKDACVIARLLPPYADMVIHIEKLFALIEKSDLNVISVKEKSQSP